MEFKKLLVDIVGDDLVHSKWLNTLSLMENTGARKISACEHKTEVTLLILKHAAEEHRHAYYLKKQITKLGDTYCPTYADQYLLAPSESRYYLNMLDLSVSRYLKNVLNLEGEKLKFAAYLLVTYAIEVRADELYPIYQEVLETSSTKVNVKSIILEEEGHLEEMLAQLRIFAVDWEVHANQAIAFETVLFDKWTAGLSEHLKSA